MSYNHTYLSALAITGSLLSGGAVLRGSDLGTPSMNQDAVVQAAACLSQASNTYLLISSGDHDRQEDRERSQGKKRPQNKESVQENNSSADDNQSPMMPTTLTRPVIVEKDHGHK